MIRLTLATKKIRQLKKRVSVIQGGQGAGKTFSILLVLINACIHSHLNKKNKEIIVASQELSKMKMTVIKDFIKILQAIEMFEPNQWNKTEQIYRWSESVFIKFVGLDKDDIGKGLRSDILFINEANKISFESYRQLSSRSKRIIIDFNPDSEFWVHTEVLTRDDSQFLILTYKDNEALSEEERTEILRYKQKGYDSKGNVVSEYWANKWRVYGLGEVGHIEGVVFENWKEIDRLPTEADLICIGLDFGFSDDPAAAVALYKYNGQIIVEEVLYQTGLLNSELATKLKQFNTVVYCDSAEPKSIADLRKYGIRALATQKGKDSINFGIKLIQEYQLLIPKNSKNLIRELINYKWATDRQGQQLDKPEDNFNHLIDAMRYGVMMKFKKNSGKYMIR